MKEKEVYIIGGGASLANFNFEVLKNKNTIAVNSAVLHVPDPDYFVTVDFSFFNKVDIKRLDFIKTTKIAIVALTRKQIFWDRNRLNFPKYLSHLPRIDFVKKMDMVINSRQAEGLGFAFNDFRHGTNSGFCGLQLAVILGFTKIHLLGFDLNSVNGKYHYHYHYSECEEIKIRKKAKRFANYFINIKDILKKKNIELISHSSVSPLNKYYNYQSLKGIF